MGDLFEALLGGAGWGVGLGVVLGAASLAGKGLRPVAKEAIKLGMTAGTRLQEWTAEMREQVDDIVAEARAEQVSSDTSAAPGGDGAPAPSGEATTTAARRHRADSRREG